MSNAYSLNYKLIAIIMAIIAFFSLLTGCSNDSSSNSNDAGNKGELTSIDINIGCMKGPTAIGMIKLLSDSDKGSSYHKYNYTIAGTADELSTALVKGDLDVAAVPCNLASILYNKTEGEILTVAINTLGVLYLVESGNDVNSLLDLRGKTIYCTGQGTTPEYTLRYLLKKAGINADKNVDIQFKSEASEVLAALKADPDALAMLPQPYVAVALNRNEDYRIAIDVTKEWGNMGNALVTGVLVARKSFIDENPEEMVKFLKEYKASTDYANIKMGETASLLESYDIFDANIAKKAIPYCNVTYIDGESMKKYVTMYLETLYSFNPESVGGKLEEGMFYIEDSKENTK